MTESASSKDTEIAELQESRRKMQERCESQEVEIKSLMEGINRLQVSQANDAKRIAALEAGVTNAEEQLCVQKADAKALRDQHQQHQSEVESIRDQHRSEVESELERLKATHREELGRFKSEMSAASEANAKEAVARVTEELNQVQLSEAARDGELTDHDKAIASLEADLEKARSAAAEANMTVSRLQEQLVAATEAASSKDTEIIELNATLGRSDMARMVDNARISELEDDVRELGENARELSERVS